MNAHKRAVQVKNRYIGPGLPVFIIAEIGTSHGGDVGLALKLLEEACRCGVDAVKLQTVNVDENYLPGEESYEIFKDLWFEYEDLAKLMRAADANNVVLFSTPGDFRSLDLMVKAGMTIVKVSSGLMTNHPLIGQIAKRNLPMIISTGMSYLHEIGEAILVAEKNCCTDIMLLHCTSQYPAKPETLNLNSIRTMDCVFPYPVGYSDHSKGMTASIAACAMGATMIEKHFSLNKSAAEPDRDFALDPRELRFLVEEVRKVEMMLGSFTKQPTNEELDGRDVYRRCLMARKPVKTGQVVDESLVAIKRPRSGERGLDPKFLDDILGMRACRDIEINENLTLDLFYSGGKDSRKEWG